jgi:glycopeptide antibiotics resistance protein
VTRIVPLSIYAVVVLATIVATAVLSRPLARWLGCGRWVAALLVFGFGIVLAVTLVPDPAALRGVPSTGVCDTSRIGLIPLDQLLRPNEYSLNVLLFVPLGLAVGLLPHTRRAAMIALAAASLTFVVEAIQLVATGLGRGCQTADLFDNLLGLAIGAAVGALAGALAARARDRDRG